MHITVSQSDLQQALSILQRAIPSKPTLPILNSVLIQAFEDKVELSVTDLYLGIKTRLPCTVVEPGTIATPGKIFSEMVSQLGAGSLDLEVDQTNIVIRSSVGTTKVVAQIAEDFPAFPTLTGTTLELPTETLQHILTMVGFAASTDITRPVLTSLFWKFSPDSLEVVGTDGFRLSIWKSTAQAFNLDQSLLLPARALQEVGKIAQVTKTGTLKLTISEELKQVECVVGDTLVYIRLLEGEYPPYGKIVPSSFGCQIEFETQEMIAHLKRALIFARDSSNIVQWQIAGDQCHIKATSATSGTHDGVMTVTNPDQTAGEIAFNARYVLDFLQACQSERVWFGMMESLKPALFRPMNDSHAQYIVMPFRVQT